MSERRATYELWDRFSGNLIHDFGDREAALEFVQRQIDGLDSAAAAREVERFALERVVDGESEVIAKGAQLLKLELSNRETWRQDLARALADVRTGRVRPWSEVARVMRERYARPRSRR